jgi:hypothetical protein
MRALGIRIPDSFSGVNSKDENKCTYTKDEREALKYIYSNKAIPTDLEQRLIDRQIPERKNTTHDITLDDNEIEQFLAKVSSNGQNKN